MRRNLRRPVSGMPSTRLVIRAAGMVVLLFGLYSVITQNLPEREAPAPKPRPVAKANKKSVAKKVTVEAKAESSPEPEAVEPPTPIGNGVDDRDPEELAAAKMQFEAVSDRAPLSTPEMPAYWRLMGWAGSQSFQELSSRAKYKPVFTRFWEQPELYRGKPFHLRLHVRRIMDYDAPKNSIGAKTVYEFWGWTDESRSYPYVVVCPELPEGMEVDADSEAEGEFVGYFLKMMSYAAHDRVLYAPLLVGKMQRVAVKNRLARTGSSFDKWLPWGVGLGIALIIGTTVQRIRSRKSKPRAEFISPTDDAEAMNWLQNQQPRGATSRLPGLEEAGVSVDAVPRQPSSPE